MIKPYGLTRHAVTPPLLAPSLWNGAPERNARGERRALATIVSETEDKVVVRATRPTAMSGFVLWTFVRTQKGWNVEGSPTIMGGEVDDMEKIDTMNTAKRFLRRTGRHVPD